MKFHSSRSLRKDPSLATQTTLASERRFWHKSGFRFASQPGLEALLTASSYGVAGKASETSYVNLVEHFALLFQRRIVVTTHV